MNSLFNKKNIQISTGFDPHFEGPIDSRLVSPTKEDMNRLLTEHAAYEGLTTYCIEERKLFTIKNGEFVNEDKKLDEEIAKVYDTIKDDANLLVINWEDSSVDWISKYKEYENSGDNQPLVLFKVNGNYVTVSFNDGNKFVANYVSNIASDYHTVTSYIMELVDGSITWKVNSTDLANRATIDRLDANIDEIEADIVDLNDELDLETETRISEDKKLQDQIDANELIDFSSANFSVKNESIEFRNEHNDVVSSLAIKDLGLKLHYDGVTGFIKLTDSLDNLITEIDTNDEKILKSAVFDDESEDLVLTFQNDDVVRIPLDSISDKIKYYTADEKTIHLTTTGTSEDWKDNSYVFSIHQDYQDMVSSRFNILEDKDTVYNKSLAEFKADYVNAKIKDGTYTSLNSFETVFVRNPENYDEFIKSNVFLKAGNHTVIFNDNTTQCTFTVEKDGYYNIYFRPNGNSVNGWYLADGKIWLAEVTSAIPASELSTYILIRGKIATMPNLTWDNPINIYQLNDNTYCLLGIELNPGDEFKIFNSNTQELYPNGDNYRITARGIYDIYFDISTCSVSCTFSSFSPFYLDNISRSFKAFVHANDMFILDAKGVFHYTFDEVGNLIEVNLEEDYNAKIQAENARSIAEEERIENKLDTEIQTRTDQVASLESRKYDKTGGTISGLVDITGTLTVGGISTFKSNLVPNTSETIDLGTSSKLFKNLYISNNLVDTAGNKISVKEIASKAELKAETDARILGDETLQNNLDQTNQNLAKEVQDRIDAINQAYKENIFNLTIGNVQTDDKTTLSMNYTLDGQNIVKNVIVPEHAYFDKSKLASNILSINPEYDATLFKVSAANVLQAQVDNIDGRVVVLETNDLPVYTGTVEELQTALAEGKISDGVYRYLGKDNTDFGVFTVKNNIAYTDIGILDANGYTLDNYLRRTGGTVTGNTTFTETVTTNIINNSGGITSTGKVVVKNTGTPTALIADVTEFDISAYKTTTDNLAVKHIYQPETGITIGNAFKFTDNLYVNDDPVLLKSEAYVLPPATTSKLGGVIVNPNDLLLKINETGLLYTDVSNYYTKQESEDRYINVTGDTMTGTLYGTTVDTKLANINNRYINAINKYFTGSSHIVNIETGIKFEEELKFDFRLYGYINNKATNYDLHVFGTIIDSKYNNCYVTSYGNYTPKVSLINNNGYVNILLSDTTNPINNAIITLDVTCSDMTKCDETKFAVSSLQTLPEDAFNVAYKQVIKDLNINGTIYTGVEPINHNLVTNTTTGNRIIDISEYYNILEIDQINLNRDKANEDKFVDVAGDTMTGNLNLPSAQASSYIKTPVIHNQSTLESYLNRINLGSGTESGYEFYSGAKEYKFYGNDSISKDTATELFRIDNTDVYYKDVKLYNFTDIKNTPDTKTLQYNEDTNTYSISDTYTSYIDSSIETVDDVEYSNDETENYINGKVQLNRNVNDPTHTVIGRYTTDYFKISDNYLTISDSFKNYVDSKIARADSIVKVDDISTDTTVGLKFNLGDESKTYDIDLLSIGNYLQFSKETNEINANTDTFDSRYALKSNYDTTAADLLKYFASIEVVTDVDNKSSKLIFKNHENTQTGELDVTKLGLKLAFKDSETESAILMLTDSAGNVLSELDTSLELIIRSGRYDHETNTIIFLLANGSEIKVPLLDLIAAFPDTVADEVTLTSSSVVVNQKETTTFSISPEYKSKIDTAVQPAKLDEFVTLATDQNITGQKSFSYSITRGPKQEGQVGYVDIGSNSTPFDRGYITYLNAPISMVTFKPQYDDSKDLGGSDRRWKDLYLSGNLSDSTTSIKVSDIVSTNTDQTITGIKDFSNGYKIGQDIISSVSEYSLNGTFIPVTKYTGTQYFSNKVITNDLYTANIYGLNESQQLDDLYLNPSDNPKTSKRIILGSFSAGSELTIGETKINEWEAISGTILNDIIKYYDNKKNDVIPEYLIKATVTKDSTENNVLTFTNNLNNPVTYKVLPATKDMLGTVIPGTTISVDDGIINVRHDIIENLVYSDEEQTFTANQKFTDIEANNINAIGSIKVNNQDIADIYATKNEMAKVYIPKGTVETYLDLPVDNNRIGDVYNVSQAFELKEATNNVPVGVYDADTDFVWTEEQTWNSLGGKTDLTQYSTTAEIAAIYLTKEDAKNTYDTITSVNNKISSTETMVDNTYAKKTMVPVSVKYTYNEETSDLSFDFNLYTKE